MAYENETALKVGFVTLSNYSLKNVAGVIANSVAGYAAGGYLGEELSDAATKRAGELGMNGHAILTDKRFVFGSGKAFKKQPVGAPLGLTEKDKVAINIPLDGINAVSRGKQGFSTLIVLETNAGNFNFAVMKKAVFEEWEAAINNALGKR